MAEEGRKKEKKKKKRRKKKRRKKKKEKKKRKNMRCQCFVPKESNRILSVSSSLGFFVFCFVSLTINNNT